MLVASSIIYCFPAKGALLFQLNHCQHLILLNATFIWMDEASSVMAIGCQGFKSTKSHTLALPRQQMEQIKFTEFVTRRLERYTEPNQH